MDTSKIRRILERNTSINSLTECWEYQGTNAGGYGQVTIDGNFYYTHQLSAMLFLGYVVIPGIIVCHKPICKSRACWNPDHLYIGTYAMNNNDIKEAGTGRGKYSDVTHCVNGHEFTPDNTYITIRKETGKERRQCRECRKVNDMERKAKLKLIRKAG